MIAKQPPFRAAATPLHPTAHWVVPKRAPGYATAKNRDEIALKWLIVALFLPEGLSFFLGDFRLSVARLLIILLTIQATAQYLQRLPRTVSVPSDWFAIAAGFWMILAPAIVEGPAAGLKSGGIMALEFTGSYWIFRHLLGPLDSSVRVISFACKLMFFVVLLAALDPLTGQLFSYETVKAFTGYSSPAWEYAKQTFADTLYRKGAVRAMGPLEHSILFGSVCAWFGTVALCTFPSRLLGWSAAAFALLGIFVSQARAPLLAYALSLGLIAYYYVTAHFTAKWKLLGGMVAVAVVVVFIASSNPLATLLNLSGIDPATRWYRQAIWEAVVPMLVKQSPLFGIGISADWNWYAHGLFGESVDSMWLRIAMITGIPASLLMLFTMIGGYLGGPLDRSPYLSREEQRLSVALGIATVAAIFLGFTVHFWGTCWILLGVFAGMRANLVEARAYRQRTGQVLIEG